MNKIKIEGELVVRCGREGCGGRHTLPPDALDQAVGVYPGDGLADAVTRAVLDAEAGWVLDADGGLACPNHLDTGGKLASFGFDEGLRRNVVLLVLDEDEARTFAGQTFRVRVDPK